MVDVGIDAFIDSAYIHDEARKISVYQRLLQINTKAGLDDFVDEVIIIEQGSLVGKQNIDNFKNMGIKDIDDYYEKVVSSEY